MVLYLQYPIIDSSRLSLHYISCRNRRSLHIGHKIVLFWNLGHVIGTQRFFFAAVRCSRILLREAAAESALRGRSRQAHRPVTPGSSPAKNPLGFLGPHALPSSETIVCNHRPQSALCDVVVERTSSETVTNQ